MFECIYFRYRNSGVITKIQQLALLKFWAEHPRKKKEIDSITIASFVEEFMKEDTYKLLFAELEKYAAVFQICDDSFIWAKGECVDVTWLNADPLGRPDWWPNPYLYYPQEEADTH